MREKNIDSEEVKSLLDETRAMFEELKDVENKFNSILNAKKMIINKYNALPKQILLYRRTLPQRLETKTKAEYIQK